MKREAFPWAEAMRFGLGVLRLPPDRFWAMTLPEFRAALAGAAGASTGGMALSREGLEALIARFPDRPDTNLNRNRPDGG
jgi:uncharacterized phage protein (TIGR02216 family)